MQKPFIVKIAELNIEITCHFDKTFNYFKDYLSDDDYYDFKINCSIDDINSLNDGSESYREFVALLRALAIKLADYNRLLIHAATIEFKGSSVLFLANSGTGKSTHINYWKKLYEDALVINGDKPIIDDKGYVYGSPWCGKEGWNTNKKSKIKAIVLLTRDSYNHIEKVNIGDCIEEILNQMYREDNFIRNIDIIDKCLKNVDVYKLGCINDISAAEVCIKEIYTTHTID